MSVVIPSLRAAIAVPPWVKNELWRRARAVPSLDLRLADNKSLSDAVTGASLVTFNRASSGTFVGSDGVLQTAATDVPRFDHNPTTGESLGLLVEEARTNGIRNNTMVGAVAGTPGTNPTLWQYVTTQSNGLAVSVIGTGTESGINYIDYRFNGTTVASPNGIAFGIDVTTAATAQTWTNSLYWKLAGGTATGVTVWQIGVIETTAGGSFITGANYTQTVPTSAALITQRPAATRTLSGGGTVGGVQMTLSISVTGNTAVDFTLRIGLPQLEQGAFATSVIATSTATATRAADVASITGSNFSSWYNQTEGGIYVSGAPRYTYGGTNTFPRSFSISNNTTTTMIDGRYRVLSPFSDSGYAIVDGGVTQATYDSASNTAGQAMCIAYKVNSFAFSIGGALSDSDTSGTVPTVDRITLGSLPNGSSALSGTIRRLTYWPVRLPNATLQAITSP